MPTEKHKMHEDATIEKIFYRIRLNESIVIRHDKEIKELTKQLKHMRLELAILWGAISVLLVFIMIG